MDEYSGIDVEKLREDIEEENIVAYFAGGYGAALIETMDIKRASSDELIDVAEKMGISIEKYQ